MVKIKEKDFVEIDYIGKIKDNNKIFDLTDKEVAKKEGLYNSHTKYGSKIICIGENQILKIIDGFLVDKEIGENYLLDIKAGEAFGKKDPSLIKIISADILKKQKINPVPGLQINASGLLGTIRSVNGGRISVDFNHPLSGKNLIYDIKINRIVENDEEKLKSLVENMLGLSKQEYSLEIKESKAQIKIKPIIPSKAKDEVKNKAKNLIPGLEVTFN